MASRKSIFLGSFVHSKSLDELELLHDTAVFVDEKGVIVAIEQKCDEQRALQVISPKLGWSSGEVSVRVAAPGQFFFPGFIGQYKSHALNILANNLQIHISTPLNIQT